MAEKLELAFKGLIVGGTMLIPGVSGGSMAMILGIYDRLISALSSFAKSKRKNTVYLAIFVLGAILGMVLLAKPLEALMTRYPKPVMFFFMGAVTGSVPMIFSKAKVKKPSWKSFIYLAIGISCVVAISYIPQGLLGDTGFTFTGILVLFLAGIVAAIALVLPGISVSHMFLMLGIYNKILEIISFKNTGDILFLLPLAAGMVIGIIASAKLLERAMNNYPEQTYLVILGFLIASVIDVFPGLPAGGEIIICILLFAAGLLAIYFLSRRNAD